MLLENYYYYFKAVLSPKFCDEVIKYSISKKKEMALIGGLDKNNLSNKEIKNLQKVRKSDIVWMDDDWVLREVRPYIEKANKEANWNFEWDYSEPCQFTNYGKGQYYDWHADSHHTPYNSEKDDPKKIGKIRKLSVTCSLTDPSEYKGGDLQFNFNHPRKSKKNNIKTCDEIRPRGSIVVFPSFVWHRVCPVEKGLRNSLVIWNCGKPFK